MDMISKEYLVNNLLSYMKNEAERIGVPIGSVDFDFRPSYVQEYIGAPSEIIPDGEDLHLFKQQTNISNEEFETIFNYCITNQYIKRIFLGKPYTVQLTEYGFDYAKDIERKDLLQNKLQTELIYINTYASSDRLLTELLLESKKQFLNDDIQLALEKLWDALERTKTLLSKDKKKSIEAICNSLGDEISPDFFDKEYALLTDIGNKYQIRHFETDKKPITNPETQKYLFFRVLSLINLTLSRI